MPPNTKRAAALKPPEEPMVQIDREIYIPHFLNTLNNKLSSGASDLYIKLFGIGINDWRALSVEYMRDQGHLRIEPAGKEKLIYVTATGQKLYSEVARVALAREKLLLRGLSQEQQATLRSLLAHLLSNVPAVNAYST
jgi:hypothetical protein